MKVVFLSCSNPAPSKFLPKLNDPFWKTAKITGFVIKALLLSEIYAGEDQTQGKRSSAENQSNFRFNVFRG